MNVSFMGDTDKAWRQDLMKLPVDEVVYEIGTSEIFFRYTSRLFL